MTIFSLLLFIALISFCIRNVSRSEICFVNEAAEMDFVGCGVSEGITAVNETSDNWVQLSPYGKFPNQAGLQVFTKNDALTICNEFNSFPAIGLRAMGIPFYVGHPDHEAFKSIYTDKKAYGRIKGMEARDGGLFANVRWSPAGKQLIEDQAFHGHSVNWRMKKIGGEWHPVSLKSVGFTNEPNIPVAPITAANEQQQEDTMNKALLAKSLGLAEDATEEQIQTAVNEARAGLVSYTAVAAALTAHNIKAEPTAIEAFVNEAKTTGEKIATVTTEAANEKTRADGEKKRADDEKVRADAATVTAVNERNARASVLIAAAIKEGRITAADKSGYEAEFANEATFEATVTKLASASPKLPTQSRINVAGRVNPKSQSRVEEIINFVNEVKTKNPSLSHDQATAQARKERPEMFVKSAVNG